jgi:integrase
LEECTYGTPYYITIEERNKIYATNLSRHPSLAIQRDIFVFQCLIGCRVGDLIKMTKGSVINGAIEYIPRKTKEGRPLTVRVPLNSVAQEIVARYKDCDGDKLLPFISEQKYNVAIKRIFMAAGLKRMVTVVNPTTREEEKRVLYEIASSHLARRTFVGNLYKQVKDPNLVGALSGHKEGSKAFARYREIDEQMKRELVDLLK